MMRSVSSLAMILALVACSGDDDANGSSPVPPEGAPGAADSASASGDATPAFDLEAPNDVVVRVGASTSFAVTVKAGVAIAVDDLPAGVTASIEGANITLTAAADAVLGDHVVAIRGEESGVTKKWARTLVVAGTPGAFDPTFGNAGILPGLQMSVQSTARDASGNYYVAGTSNGGTVAATIVRYLPSGELDKSYGQGGYVMLIPTGKIASGAYLAVAPDGTLRVATAIITNGAYSQSQSCVTKLDAKGIVDTTFGDAGFACVSKDMKVTPRAIRVLADGSIVHVSDNFLLKYEGVNIEKLTPAGKRDLSFGKDGFAPLTHGVEIYFRALAIDSQGRIIVSVNENGGSYVRWVHRYDALGHADLFFNQLTTPGYAVVKLPGLTVGYFAGLTVGDEDAIYLSGTGDGQLLVAGLDASGAPLTSLGPDGFRRHALYGDDVGMDITYVSGKLVVTGRTSPAGVGIRTMIARLDAPTGDLDPTFAKNGSDYFAGKLDNRTSVPNVYRGRVTVVSSADNGLSAFSVARVWE